VDLLEQLIRPEIERHDLAGIPCYFENFAAQSIQWACEAKHLLAHIEYVAADIGKQSERTCALELTRDRLRTYVDAYVDHGRILRDLLAPLRPEQLELYDYFSTSRKTACARRAGEPLSEPASRLGLGIEENRRTLALMRALFPRSGRSKGARARRGSLPAALRHSPRLPPDITVVTTSIRCSSFAPTGSCEERPSTFTSFHSCPSTSRRTP